MDQLPQAYARAVARPRLPNEGLVGSSIHPAAAGVLLSLVVSFSMPATAADTFRGNVVGISDGDTITVLRDRTPVKIRLAGVDCPEAGQDFGQRARQFTATMVFGKTVAVSSGTLDRYGRLVASVSVEDQDLGLALVKAGLAWHYKQYSRDAVLARAEVVARAEGTGLWRQPHPTPPWEFRHPSSAGARARQHPAPFTGTSAAVFSIDRVVRTMPARTARGYSRRANRRFLPVSDPPAIA